VQDNEGGGVQETGKEMNTEELRDLYLIKCLELTTFRVL